MAIQGQKWTDQKAAEDKLLQYYIFEEQATTKPDAIFLIFEERQYTYGQFYLEINKVANWMINELGIEKGEIVALNGPNSPEYIMMWFALDAIGAIPSFINCNLTDQPLLHCVKVSNYVH
jgi:acyl-CoA synthetase (AMP-forming)/AMP-acid ligase II